LFLRAPGGYRGLSSSTIRAFDGPRRLISLTRAAVPPTSMELPIGGGSSRMRWPVATCGVR